MNDPSEEQRRQLVESLNRDSIERSKLEKQHGRVWNTTELQVEFTIEAFLSPFVLARRKSDGQRGTLMFTHSPRFYFSFKEE